MQEIIFRLDIFTHFNINYLENEDFLNQFIKYIENLRKRILISGIEKEKKSKYVEQT